jgi:phospholipid N-methyltransferase
VIAKKMFDCAITKEITKPLNGLNQSILSMIKIEKCKKILEAGAGAGVILPFLMSIKPNDCEYFATEYSADLLTLF